MARLICRFLMKNRTKQNRKINVFAIRIALLLLWMWSSFVQCYSMIVWILIFSLFSGGCATNFLFDFSINLAKYNLVNLQINLAWKKLEEAKPEKWNGQKKRNEKNIKKCVVFQFVICFFIFILFFHFILIFFEFYHVYFITRLRQTKLNFRNIHLFIN